MTGKKSKTNSITHKTDWKYKRKEFKRKIKPSTKELGYFTLSND